MKNQFTKKRQLKLKILILMFKYKLTLGNKYFITLYIFKLLIKIKNYFEMKFILLTNVLVCRGFI